MTFEFYSFQKLKEFNIRLLFTLTFIFFAAEIVFGQFYFFGRNKVQYEEFEWKVLRTEHFNIYYYDEMEEIARIGAFYAEEIYDELKVRMNHVVINKIPLIFYNTQNHFQQTNTTPGFIPEGVGGFFEFIKGRVVIPYTGALQDFRHVIRHEIVHVFMTTKIIRILADHRLTADTFPPLWFVEGLAEYMSTEVDAQANMVIRDAVINNYFVGLDDFYRIYGSYLMYKEGQNFLEFVEKKYGCEKIILLIENFWMYPDFDDVIEYTIGKKIEDINKEWIFYAKRENYPILQNNTIMTYAAEQLTDFGFNFSPVYYKNDVGEFIYFNANRDGYSSLYKIQINLLDNEEAEPELVLRGEKTDEFSAFHLFQSAIDISISGRIAFVTRLGANDAIHFYSIEDDEVEFALKRDNLLSISSPKFSKDGMQLVFQAIDQKGFSDIYQYSFLSDSITRLTNDYYDDRAPTFSADQNIIFFSSDRTSGTYKKKYNIFSYSLSANKINYVTYLNSNSYDPIVSPDGVNLLFTSDIDGVRNIWKLRLTNNNASTDSINKVTNFITSSFDPKFIDASTFIFCGFEGFSFNIYKSRFDNPEIHTTETAAMNFDSIDVKWIEGSLKVNTEVEKADYEKEYTLDYAQSQITTDPVFGTRGGAVLSLSDLFGNDNYFFLIYNTAEVQSDLLKSFNIMIQRLELGERSNYGYGVFNFSGRRYDIRDSDEYYFERSFGGFFLLHFPLSKFQRIETSVSIANSDKQVITGVIERKALLLTNSISFVMDNSIWSPSGPVDGIRARLLLGYTGDVKFSNVNYFTVIADYRQYLRLGFMSSLAFRGAVFYNEGKEARRYFMGGSWDLRGWNRWSIRGEKMWMSSLELRFPLIEQINIKFPFVNIGFGGIRGAAFFDAGSAWDSEYKTTLGSIGAGIRFNLFNIIVLRYDMGKKIQNDFKEFQPGLFYQFFFGWDF